MAGFLPATAEPAEQSSRNWLTRFWAAFQCGYIHSQGHLTSDPNMPAFLNRHSKRKQQRFVYLSFSRGGPLRQLFSLEFHLRLLLSFYIR